jgi:hypothetical protein
MNKSEYNFKHDGQAKKTAVGIKADGKRAHPTKVGPESLTIKFLLDERILQN